MKVCVTGAAGFIGQHVCRALREAKHEILALDARSPADYWDAWKPWDITQSMGSLGALDAVIHLAAMANPRECDANPASAFNVNVNGTLQVLKMALASGAKKVVFSSSAHVYGISPRFLPTPETHPLTLGNTYTTTKILGEQLCQAYFENHGLSYTTLRLFNAYGKGQGLGYYIPDQIAKAKAGKIDLQGSDVTKDWVHVSDVADAFVKALNSSFCGPINIGTGTQTNLGTIARFIADAYGVELITHPAEKPTYMQSDSRRAGSILSWHPALDVFEGLREVVEVPMRAVA